MKKILAIAMAALMMAGCGSSAAAASTAGASADAAETSASKSTELDDKSVLANGMVISLDEAYSDVEAVLGNSGNSESVASCAYNGDEAIYTYDGIVVHTYPSDNGEKVNSYEVVSDMYKVSGDIQVGSSSDGLKDAYPDGTDTGMAYLVTYDDYGRSYTYDNGKVTKIEIYDIVK